MAALGATLAVVSPQVQRTTREREDQPALPFTLLRDAGNRVAAAYGLAFALPEDLRQVYRSWNIDLAQANGDDSWVLPIPARFVIDRDGIIRAADADPDYRRRPEATKTLADLRALR